MDNEYRIDIKVRNNLILKRIDEAGYDSIPKFCKSIGISYVLLLDVISMKLSPLKSDGTWRECISKTAEFLGCNPSDLFTDTQMKAILKSNKRQIEINEAEMKFLLEQDNSKQVLLEQIVAQEQMNDLIGNALDTLNPREKKILDLRFGREDGKEYTLDECAQIVGKSRERIRQIEAKALRKLRHPSISYKLREFTELN